MILLPEIESFACVLVESFEHYNTTVVVVEKERERLVIVSKLACPHVRSSSARDISVPASRSGPDPLQSYASSCKLQDHHAYIDWDCSRKLLRFEQSAQSNSIRVGQV